MALKKVRKKANTDSSPPGLQRESVAKAALTLLDEVGLDGLTMRRLAEALGVQNPALYWHFKNKQALLDEMAAMLLHDAFAAAVPPGPRAPWTRWVRVLAETFRAAMLARRDGARLIASANLARSDLLRGLDITLAKLIGFGFDPRDALVGLLTVTDYTLGSTFEGQTDPCTSDPGSLPAEERRRTYAPYPTLGPLLEKLLSAGAPKPGTTFEVCLQLVIDGLATRLPSNKRR